MFTLPGLRATKEAECLLYAARRISSVELPIFAFEQLDSLGNNVFLIASAGDNIAQTCGISSARSWDPDRRMLHLCSLYSSSKEIWVSADQVPGPPESKTSGGYKSDERASKKISQKYLDSLMHLVHPNLWWRTYA